MPLLPTQHAQPKMLLTPRVVVNFDGAVHQFADGTFHTPTQIDGDLVPGVLDAIRGWDEAGWLVAIHSAGRSPSAEGREAMKNWLVAQAAGCGVLEPTAGGLKATPYADALRRVEWPEVSPPCRVRLDPRAIRFEGEFPTADDLVRVSADSSWKAI